MFGSYRRAGSWNRLCSYLLPMCTSSFCGFGYQFLADGEYEKYLLVDLCHWSNFAFVVGIDVDCGCGGSIRASCMLFFHSFCFFFTEKIMWWQTGRVGADAPSENIIATIIAGLGAQSLPLLLPFAHRFGHRALFKGVVSMSIIIIALMAIYAMKVPFDAMHQKRLFVLHLENVSLGCCFSSSSVMRIETLPFLIGHYEWTSPPSRSCGWCSWFRTFS